MPAKKEDLYHLIHSLSKAEKRYCSVEIAKGGSKTERYLQLLNAINKMDQFDDEALKEKSFVKSLPTDKIWLYDNLLKHLRNFRFEKSVQAQIHHSLEAAQILHEKNLETQALRLLDKAKKQALAIHDNISLLEIIRKQIKYLNIRQIQGKKTVVDSLIEEGQSVLKLIQEEEKYKGLRNSLAYMLTQKRKLSKEDFMQNLEGFEKDIFEKDTPTINSFNALSDFLYAKATYYHLIGNYASYFKYSRERIELWEQQKQLSNANQFEYIILLQSFINSTIYHGRFDLTEAYIEKQVAKANREQSFTSIRAYSVYLCRFLYYFNTKQPEKTKELAKDIVKLLKENNLHPKYQLALQINMVSFFFVCEEWKNCLFWIESIISKKYGEHRRDLQNIARIYKLIALYEIGDSDQLDNQFRSIKRYFNLHGKIKKHNYAWALFEGLKNTHLAIPGRNKHTAIEALHNYVQAKRKSPDKELAGLHEISLWLQSKLQQKNILFLLNS